MTKIDASHVLLRRRHGYFDGFKRSVLTVWNASAKPLHPVLDSPEAKLAWRERQDARRLRALEAPAFDHAKERRAKW